jgi:hypothetical protein
MKPNKFDVFYWWGLLFSSIPLLIIFFVIGILKAFLPDYQSVHMVIVKEVINIEQEPKPETNTKVEEILPVKKVLPKVTVQDTGHHTVHHTGHHTVQDTVQVVKKIVELPDTIKKLE